MPRGFVPVSHRRLWVGFWSVWFCKTLQQPFCRTHTHTRFVCALCHLGSVAGSYTRYSTRSLLRNVTHGLSPRRFSLEPIPLVSLTTGLSILSSVSNGFLHEGVFVAAVVSLCASPILPPAHSNKKKKPHKPGCLVFKLQLCLVSSLVECLMGYSVSLVVFFFCFFFTFLFPFRSCLGFILVDRKA